MVFKVEQELKYDSLVLKYIYLRGLSNVRKVRKFWNTILAFQHDLDKMQNILGPGNFSILNIGLELPS
jgi:hypothetical protein